MKFVHACGKSRKSRRWLKVKGNSGNARQKEKWQQKIIEIWILLPKESPKMIL